MLKDIIYKIKKQDHKKEKLIEILTNHPEIKFVSLMAIDLFGNATDERIPIKIFLNDMDNFLNGIAIQTDGSSVDLPEISSIDNAKVDIKLDLDCDWFVDYNEELLDEKTNKQIGTIIIPSFLYHDGKAVDSRSILKSSIEKTREIIINLLKDNLNYNNINDINFTVATELEFWVKTPNKRAKIEELTTSQVMNEQYWNKIDGIVRIALEECLLLMEKYELQPEMGHKEVGGVRPELNSEGKYDYVMEQVEIDWKYSNPIQASDNQIIVKNLIKKTFMKYGLETSFMAKPIENVAGNGMHVHLGIVEKLKEGNLVNIFNSVENSYLSVIGYGALMGILKNYEIINPFISATNDSFKRLKPGYEAPVSIVASLGNKKEEPSRNRSVLIGLIKDNKNPLATRFELRSPNPCSNLYLTVAGAYLLMLDGIKYAIKSKKTENELYLEISKQNGEESQYLEYDKKYISEENIFEFYTEEERNKYFGESPRTVYENLINFDKYPEKLKVIQLDDIFSDSIIKSFKKSSLNKWKTTVTKVMIKEYFDEISSFKKLYSNYKLDNNYWSKIERKMKYIYKDTEHSYSLFSRIEKAFDKEDYNLASNLVLELDNKMEELKKMYAQYEKNIITQKF